MRIQLVAFVARLAIGDFFVRKIVVIQHDNEKNK
jgi:hypothetical protein